MKSEAEGLLGVGGDAEAVVGAFADEPEYALLGIGEDELCSFLKDVLLAVGEIIADEFCAGHAEGDEAVAGLYVAQGQGELDVGCVEGGAVGSVAGFVAVATFFGLHLQLQAVAKHVCAGFGYAHGADVGCGCFGLEDEGTAVEGEFVCAGGDDFACGVGVERGVYLLDLCRGEASGAEYFVEGVLGGGLLLQSGDGDDEF